MRKIDSDSGHRAIITAGPANSPYIKFFTARNIGDLNRRMQSFNHDNITLHRVSWCPNDSDAEAFKAGLEGYCQRAEYPMTPSGFYMLPMAHQGEQVIEMMMEAVVLRTDIEPCSDQDRAGWLNSQALQRTHKVMEKAAGAGGRG